MGFRSLSALSGLSLTFLGIVPRLYLYASGINIFFYDDLYECCQFDCGVRKAVDYLIIS